MKFAYLDTYFPPAPGVEIKLGYPTASLRLGPFVAVVDTGADGTLVIGPLRLPSIEVLGDDVGTEIVLGRNLLNKLRLLLDGRTNYVELLDK